MSGETGCFPRTAGQPIAPNLMPRRKVEMQTSRIAEIQVLITLIMQANRVRMRVGNIAAASKAMGMCSDVFSDNR